MRIMLHCFSNNMNSLNTSLMRGAECQQNDQKKKKKITTQLVFFSNYFNHYWRGFKLNLYYNNHLYHKTLTLVLLNKLSLPHPFLTVNQPG